MSISMTVVKIIFIIFCIALAYCVPAKLTLTPSRIRSSSPTSKSRNMISILWQVKNCKHWQRLRSINPLK